MYDVCLQLCLMGCIGQTPFGNNTKCIKFQGGLFMDISVQDQIKLKFKDGAVCPHCGSRAVNKFGFFNEKQRYRCKQCKKTFNLYTNTLLSWSHYKDKWEAFINTMEVSNRIPFRLYICSCEWNSGSTYGVYCLIMVSKVCF